MQQNPSWEANRFSASQEIISNLWNPKVHYRFYRHLPLFWFRSVQSKPNFIPFPEHIF
jgi:hypothetical protein